MRKIRLVTSLGLFSLLATPLGAAPIGQSDLTRLNPVTGGDTAVYCGVRNDSWLLNIAATAGSANATLAITFRDLTSISFNIPAGTSFSLNQALGGSPDVDDVVKITLGPVDTGAAAMVSARTRVGARDLFNGDNTNVNFCLTAPNDPGTASAQAIIP